MYDQEISRISGTRLLNFKEKARDILLPDYLSLLFLGQQIRSDFVKIKILNEIRMVLINSCLCLQLLYRRQRY
jgi:hypothetical protein